MRPAGHTTPGCPHPGGNFMGPKKELRWSGSRAAYPTPSTMVLKPGPLHLWEGARRARAKATSLVLEPSSRGPRPFPKTIPAALSRPFLLEGDPGFYYRVTRPGQ